MTRRAAAPLRWIVALCALVAAPVAAQEGPTSPEAPATPAEPTGEEAQAPQVSAAELLSTSLSEDIGTASFYELVAWCRELGLDDTGTRQDLQQRLFQHYGIEPGPAPARGKRTVSVRSAREADYLTIDVVGESYLVLRGDVIVEMRDEENDSVHEIRAQTVTVNQTRNTLAADGGVSYTLRQGDRVESFEGTSLEVDLTTWEGIFSGGRTTKTQKVGDADVTFRFQGDSVTRLSDDTVILSGGTFTSCDETDPHYTVHAKKAWILAPGEWALENAVLKIGEVPVLWLPAFFLPGDRFFFNPSFGYRVREGSYIQTTTYLIGRKKQDEGIFSFLRLQEAGDSYQEELHGLFLRKLPTRLAAPQEDRTLKLMLDGYSRLGLFSGLAGDFPPLASFNLGIARSRSLYLDPLTGSWSALWPLPDGSTTSYWNSADFLGIPVPFRYGFEGKLAASSADASVTARFEFYSDPSFSQDFLSRSEGLQLTPELEFPEATLAQQKPTLVWEVASRLDFTRMLAVPTVQSFTIPSLGARFTWQSRDVVIDPLDPLRLAKEADPGSTFYYPGSLTAPYLSANLTGELLRLPAPALAAPQTAGSRAGAEPPGGPVAPASGPGRGFHSPDSSEEAGPSSPARAPAPGRLEVRGPIPLPDVGRAPAEPAPTLSVTYQVTPRSTLDTTFDSSAWNTPQDIDMRVLYSTFEASGTERLAAAASLAGGRLGLSGSLAADSLWRLRFAPSTSLTPSQWQALLLGDLQQDRLDLTTTLGITAQPFLADSPLGGSSSSWRIGLRLFQLRFSGGDPLDPVFTPRTLDFSRDMVTEHSLQSTFRLSRGAVTNALSVSAVLPPLDEALSARLDTSAGPVRLRLQGGVQSPGGVWDALPLLAGLTIQPLPTLSLSEEVQLDPMEQTLERSTTTLTAWSFSGVFVAQRMLPVSPIGAPTGDPVRFLPATVRLAWQPTMPTVWSWQDRVRVDAGLRTSWSMNLQRYTDNLFEFAPSLTLSIYQVLDLTFSSLSVNTKTYRYIPGLPEKLGETWVNPLADLAGSFSFLDTRPPATNDRYRSAFKIRSLSLKAVHHLHDWDLSVEYQGSPQLTTDSFGNRQYTWGSTLLIQLKWVAVPEVQSRVHYDEVSGLVIRG